MVSLRIAATCTLTSPRRLSAACKSPTTSSPSTPEQLKPWKQIFSKESVDLPFKQKDYQSCTRSRTKPVSKTVYLHHNSQSLLIIFVHWTQPSEYWTHDTDYMLFVILVFRVLYTSWIKLFFSHNFSIILKCLERDLNLGLSRIAVLQNLSLCAMSPSYIAWLYREGRRR